MVNSLPVSGTGYPGTLGQPAGGQPQVWSSLRGKELVKTGSSGQPPKGSSVSHGPYSTAHTIAFTQASCV